MTTFKAYADAGFGAELLPILPPDAAISPDSPSGENLEKSRGKVPGRRRRNGWVGFGGWPEHLATPEDHMKWDRSGSGMGLQGRVYIGADIDVDVPDLADAIEAEGLFTMGLAPCRFGRGARRLLVFRCPGLHKRRLAFRLPGSDPTAPPEAVEILGQGQQYVVEGIHPKTGEPYHWRDGSGPAQWGAAGLTEVSAEEVDQFLENVRWLVEEMYDAELVDVSGTGRVGASSGRSGTWQEGLLAPSREALVDALGAIENDLKYDPWFKLMVAVKAAGAAIEDAEDIFADWSATSGEDRPGVTAAKWESIRAPYSVGWSHIEELAAECSGGAFSGARYEFDAVDVGSSDTPAEPPTPDSMNNMFQRYAWVEGAQRVVDLATGDLLNQEQFEFRVPPMYQVKEPGKEGEMPSKAKLSPWRVFKENPKQRRSYKNLTCRFGGPLVVQENLPDLQGECLNTWREPRHSRPIPAEVTEDELSIYFELAAHVVPNRAEREHVFNFMAFTAQRPGEKINHALVLGSRVEGMGKDTLLEPLREAIGKQYTRDIKQPQLIAPFNKWLVGCKLLVVQEMHNFERKATMNLLKPLVAAPPEALSVNLKGVQEFFVPNLLSTVFFTNEPDALAVQNGDRRYFITWNDGQPKPEEFYDRVWTWMRDGGCQKVVRWLLTRDISKFNARGRAPETAAKETMRQETRSPLLAWIEDGIADEDAPFDRDLFLVDDVVRRAPEYVRYKGQQPGPHKIAGVLKGTQSRPVSGKIRIPGVDGARVIWACRRVETYAGQTDDVLRGLFVKQRDEKAAADLKEAFR